MLSVREHGTGKVVVRHISLRPCALIVVVLTLTIVAVFIDHSRPRAALTCYRHETDPNVANEDIDCILHHHLMPKSLSFELGRVSIAPVPRTGGMARRLHGDGPAALPRPSDGQAPSAGMYAFEVRLHRKFPTDSADIPLFRFHSR